MRIKANTLAGILVVILAAGPLFASITVATRRSAHDSEKSLDIERYSNEPFELVDLRVGEQSVKSNIKITHRYAGNGLDNVRFQETDEWFRRVKVRLRNTSDRPVMK